MVFAMSYQHHNQSQLTPIQPQQFHVDAIDSGYVTAHGPGLSHGVSGSTAGFTIVTKHAGAGLLVT